MDSQDSYYSGSYEGIKGRTEPVRSQEKNLSLGISPADSGFLGSFPLSVKSFDHIYDHQFSDLHRGLLWVELVTSLLE